MCSMPNSTLMHEKILLFYKSQQYEKFNDNFSVFFQFNSAFDAVKIVDYIWPNLECDEVWKELENYKYEDYLQCCKKLEPIFQYTSKIINDLNKNADRFLKLQWMGNNVNLYLDMKSNYNNTETATYEHTLLLTSLLANALTNVYMSQIHGNHGPPHLLKDLISSFEIKNFFGLEMVILLKVLMGSPNSINLRNIVWHGFPKPMDIPTYYVNVLLITVHSLGCVIENKKIPIIERSPIQNFNEHVQLIKNDFQLKPMDLTYMEEKIKKINNDYVIYWLQLLCHYKSEKYKEFILLVLPQIELLLRLHYGTINNCDISAKLDEYYITMDTIFKSELINGDKITQSTNKLLDFEKSTFKGCFNLLYDIFISPNGCRLRDKVSHGEVNLEALNNPQLSLLILYIFLSLLLPDEITVFENYESKLHLNSATKFKLTKCFKTYELFCKSYIQNNQEVLLKQFSLEHEPALIFKRPKKESELMLLINKIAGNIIKTIFNYEESINLRSTLLAQRELHSKRRKTLEKLQNALPSIFKTLSSIISSCNRTFTILQTDCLCILENELAFVKTVRFLKHCLKTSENFVKYSHCENNEWIKSLELCRKYYDFHTKLFIYDS